MLNSRLKLQISYETKERKYHGEGVFSFVLNEAMLEPIKIIRRPCGEGAAAKRYHYEGVFKSPENANDNGDGYIRVHINRKLNPFFKPKYYVFVNNIAQHDIHGWRP